MTAKNSNFSGLLYYNPGSQGFNPVDSASIISPVPAADEGDTITYKIITWNIANGTTLYWRVSNPINLTLGRFDNISGTISINNSSSSIDITVSADNSTATGAQSFDIIVSKTNNGPAIGTLVAMAVNDNSQDPRVVALDLDARNYLPPNGSTITVSITFANGAYGFPDGSSGSYFRYQGSIPTQPSVGDTFVFNGQTYTIAQVTTDYPVGQEQYYLVGFKPYLSPDGAIAVNSTIDIAHGPTGLTWPSGIADANRPGVFQVAPSFTADGAYGFGNYITFNGTSDYAVVPTLQNSTFKEITMSVWANSVDISSTQTLMSKELAYKMRLSNNGSTVYLNTLAGWSNSGWLSNGGPSNIPVGGWHHYAVTISKTSITTYVDGVSLGSASGVGALPTNTAAFIIGSYGDAGPGADFFIGKIGVAKLYTYALTGTEISDYYNLTKSRYITVTSITADVTGYNPVNNWLLPDISGNPDLTQVKAGWTVSAPGGFSAVVTADAFIAGGSTNWAITINATPSVTGTYTFTAP